ncbi:MAG: type II secretion system protein [Bacilli bacterium]
MVKKQGFTLVELLAVIVVLGIILVIAIPNIQQIITNARIEAYERQKEFIADAAKKYVASNIESVTFDEANRAEVTLTTLQENGLLPNPLKDSRGNTFDSNKTIVIISGKDNKYSYQVSVESDLYDTDKEVNKPLLVKGMTPIKWNGSSWVNTTEDDPDWYSYTTTDKKWANARTAEGSMWVWIPAYAYQIATNYHTSTAGTINIKFLKGLTKTASDGTTVGVVPTYSGSSQTNFIEHPGFRFGSDRVSGIWVAKFEATASEGLANSSAGDDVTTKTVRILPNVQSWRYISIGNAFQVSRNMETNSVYGWGTSGSGIDTHLMKNSEWGAVAYLSRSSYGQTTEIWINPANNFTTGCAGDSATSSQTTGCLRTYNTTNGQKASTTGNIYGIYDMSGGAWERVSAYVNNAHTNLTTYGPQIISADSKYKDIYAMGATDTQANNYALTVNFKGDAVWETSSNINGSFSWFDDYSYMPNTNVPWFIRGGNYWNGSFAGAFGFYYTSGGPYNDSGFRPVLLVKAGL